MTPAAALQAGWSIIPTGRDKRPIIPAWKPYQTRQPTAAEFSDWSRLNPPTWGLVTGAISHRITLDFDGEKGRQTLARLNIPQLTPHRQTPSGGFHVDFKHPGWHVPTLNAKSKRELGERWPGLDIRADGGYVCFTGRTERGEYRWLRDPETYELGILPTDLQEFLGLLKPPAAANEQQPNGKIHVMPANGRVDTERLIRSALDRVGNEGRNNGGFWLAGQLRDNGYSQNEAAGAMQSYRARVPSSNTKGECEPYTESEMLASLREAYSRPPRKPWERKAVPELAPADKAKHRQYPNIRQAPEPTKPPNLLDVHEPEDVGNAQRLIAMYGRSLRYCHPLNKWFVWDSRRWALDESDCVRELTHKTMKAFASQAVEANHKGLMRFAVGCRRTTRITNATREARPYLRIKPTELDTHPDLLNFMNGTVDLKTGRLMPHNPDHFITKLVHYAHRPEATCPTFVAFLERITANHPGLISYLQKAFGYSLTGHTIEKAVFLLYGRGDNGKSTLLSTFLKLLGEYAVLLQIDTLMVRAESNNTQADLADLRGARFVMTSETEEGQRLAEGKLKRITQGMGRIKATRKYENPVEFPESHKLFVDMNHPPVVRGTDNAIWNRLHAIPFDVTIPKDEQDPELPDKLIAEAEGILAWAVAGAVRWHSERLGKPPDVEQTVQAWRAKSDQIGRFIEACCIKGVYAQIPARKLYAAYRTWAEESGERVDSEPKFSDCMSERGFAKERKEAGMIYLGVGLVAVGPGRS